MSKPRELLSLLLRSARRAGLFSQPVLGQIDHASDGILRGWAWAPDAGDCRLVLDVFHQGIFLGQAFAGAYREDLQRHGIGDGRHHFVFHLPEDVPRHFRIADITVSTMGPERRMLPASVDLSPPRHERRRPRSDPRTILGPLLAATRERRTAATLPLVPGHRSRVDPLCREEPGVGVSAFLVHIARKYDRPFAADDLPALLRWYLEDYATERGPRRVPLSRQDMGMLLAPSGHGPSVAAAIRASEAAAGDPCGAYLWVAQVSCRLFVEDCLITAAQEEQAAGVPPDQTAQSYPLSNFMALYRERSAMLRRFRPERERDRQAIYILLLVVALRRPSIVNAIPSSWLNRLFADGDAADALLRRLFGTHPPLDAAMLRSALRGAGVSIPDWSWRPHACDGHRILHGATVAAGEVRHDVQLIGPLSSNTGLGESCRRLARALLRTSLRVNLVDYAIGSARNAVDTGLPLAGICCARLNILHLNLEEVPEAIAFLPDVFSGRPTVAVPYWELSAPSAVHRLGLAVVDELWVASRFLRDVFAPTGIPVRWIGMCCDEEAAPSSDQRDDIRRGLGIKASTFLFLTTSDARSWVQRKNPLDVIEAFQAAFAGDDVALIVKTHGADAPLSPEQRRYWRRVRDLCEGDPRIVFVDASFAREKQRALLAAADCFVTLHRAEGLGLDTLDALRRGTPVVATDYSGVTDVCCPQTAWMVAADRVAVAPSDYCFVEAGHLWAAPSRDAAASALRGVFFDADDRHRKVEAARRLVGEVATTEALAQRLERLIREKLAGGQAPA